MTVRALFTRSTRLGLHVNIQCFLQAFVLLYLIRNSLLAPSISKTVIVTRGCVRTHEGITADPLYCHRQTVVSHRCTEIKMFVQYY